MKEQLHDNFNFCLRKIVGKELNTFLCLFSNHLIEVAWPSHVIKKLLPWTDINNNQYIFRFFSTDLETSINSVITADEWLCFLFAD